MTHPRIQQIKEILIANEEASAYLALLIKTDHDSPELALRLAQWKKAITKRDRLEAAL